VTEALITSVVPRVRIEGNLVEELTLELLDVRIEETLDGLKTLELTLFADSPEPGVDDRPANPRFLDGESIDFGKRIEVVLGPESDPVTAFDGKISAIELEFEESVETRVRVFAEDELMQLRMTRRVQAWNDSSDADIAQAIASRHGLDVDADASGPTWESVLQLDMSDLAFLRERARLIGAEVWVDQAKLYFKARKDREAPTLELARGGDLLELVIRADLAHQRTAVRVRGWDANRAEAFESVAEGSLIRDELGSNGGRTGPELLTQTFGDRGSVRVREVAHDEDQGRAIAEAELRRRARSFVSVSGLTRGSARMIVGSRLSFDYVGPLFEGEGYYVTEVCHTYDREHGFRTRFDAERATLNEGTNG
jgi:phage protein D